MSRSRKDGRRGGGHLKLRELWSRRCPITNMWIPNRSSKTITHQYERRVARGDIEAQFAELLAR